MKYPPVPKAARPTSYRTKQLELKNEDGSTSYFDILMSRNSAYGFIVSTLRDMNFPMAASQWRLRDYQDDPEYYLESMSNWENDTSNFDSDMSTNFYSRGKWYSLDVDTTLEQAIAALRAAEYVDSLIHINDSSEMIFNGWIYYNERYGDWEADIDEPKGAEEYQWKTTAGTQIEVYPAE